MIVTINLFILLFGIVSAELILRYLQYEEGHQVKYLVRHPELGYILDSEKKGVVKEWGIFTAPFETEKPAGTFRILVIGDSVAWQSSDKCFISLLREQLKDKKIEVVNAAIPGYTIYQEKVMLERLLTIEPDLVLLQYCTNDHHKFLHQLSEDGHWLWTQEAKATLAPTDNSVLAWFTLNSRIVRSTRWHYLKWMTEKTAWNRQPDVGPAWTSRGWNFYTENLDAMLSAAGDIPMAVIAFPYRPQFKSTEDEAFFPQQRLGEVCEKRNLPLLDMTEILRDDPEGYFDDTLHLSDEGHKLAADGIMEFLRRQNLLPAAP